MHSLAALDEEIYNAGVNGLFSPREHRGMTDIKPKAITCKFSGVSLTTLWETSRDERGQIRV